MPTCESWAGFDSNGDCIHLCSSAPAADDCLAGLVVGRCAPDYRIDSTSQVTNIFTTSTVSTVASGAGGVVWLLVQFVVHSAGGSGDVKPGPSVEPPSAQVTAAIDTTRRQVPANCLSFDIFDFPSYVGDRRIKTKATAVVV